MEEALYWYWFVNISGIGKVTRNKLMEIYGSPKQLWQVDLNDLKQHLTANQADKLIHSRDEKQVRRAYKKLQENHILFTYPEDMVYPDSLHELIDKPTGLYVKGKLPDTAQPLVAIVGTRTPSTYGVQMTKWFAKRLAERGVGIVSGLAAGVDAISHQAALACGGYTLGVLGGGIDTIYPRNNFSLYMDMYERGGVISEYNMGVPNRSGLFPERNRIISGLADVVLIVEAAERSGSLITADHALEQGKDICVIPGRITDPLSHGCNGLIRQGANPVQDPEEILEDLEEKLQRYQKFHAVPKEDDNKKKQVYFADKQEQEVYDMLQYDEAKSAGILARNLQMDVSEVLRILLNLEMKGYIVRDELQRYARKV